MSGVDDQPRPARAWRLLQAATRDGTTPGDGGGPLGLDYLVANPVGDWLYRTFLKPRRGKARRPVTLD